MRDRHGALTWQHVWSPTTVTNLGWYRRSYQGKLLPSANDTPLSTRQLRKHVRHGALINLTHKHKEHILQLGADAQRVTPDESFSFFVTDLDEGVEFDADNSGFGLYTEYSVPLEETIVPVNECRMRRPRR